MSAWSCSEQLSNSRIVALRLAWEFYVDYPFRQFRFLRTASCTGFGSVVTYDDCRHWPNFALLCMELHADDTTLRLIGPGTLSFGQRL